MGQVGSAGGMGFWPFRKSQAAADAERLLAAVVRASRRPVFYGAGRTPDTLEGRLEMMHLHAGLALIRLGREAALEPLAQAFVDRYFKHLDAGLREAAVGDLAVPKRMRQVAGGFYGRLRAYTAAVEATDSAAFADALARNLGVDVDFAQSVSDYATRLIAAQQGAPVRELLEDAGWTVPLH